MYCSYIDVFSSFVKLITFYVPSENLSKLLKIACYISFAIVYGSVTWDSLASYNEIYRICAAWRIALRRIWRLPYIMLIVIMCLRYALIIYLWMNYVV